MAVLYTTTVIYPSVLVGAYAVRLQHDLGFGTAELGIVISVRFVASTLSSALGGPFIDRVGASTGLRIATFVSAGSSVGIALLVHSWPGLALGLAGSGLGAALCQLSANRLLVLRTADHRLGVGFGIKQAAVPSAALLAGFTVAALGMGMSWRTTYLAAALVAMTLSALAPRAKTRMSARPRPEKITDAERAPLLRLAFAGASAGAAGNSLALLAVDAFEEGGFSETSAALILAVGSGAALGVRVLAGWVVDRRQASGHPQLVILLAAGTIGFLVLATASNRVLMVAGGMVAFAAGWGWNGLLYFAATRSAGTRPATATGLVMSGVGAGTIFGPLLIAFIADHAGYGMAWGTAAGLIAAGTVMARVAGVRFRAASEA